MVSVHSKTGPNTEAGSEIVDAMGATFYPAKIQIFDLRLTPSQPICPRTAVDLTIDFWFKRTKNVVIS